MLNRQLPMSSPLDVAIQCIFCFEEKMPSKEDVFPTSIGGRFWIPRVCRDCNSYFGAYVDCLLTDHSLALMMRYRYGITGKSGTIPPVLHTGTMTVSDGQGGARDIKVHMKSNPKTGALVPSIIPNIIESRIGTDDARSINAIFATEAEARKWLQRELKRGGIAPATDEEFEEIFRRTSQASNIENPTVRFQPKLDEISIRKPLLKICYELAWYWIDDSWLQDPVAKKLRKVLRGSAEGQLPIRGEIGLFGGAEIQRLITHMHIEPHEHLGLVMRTGGRLVLFATVFNTFCAMIVVSEKPDHYSIAEYSGNYVLVDVRTRRHREGTMAELIRLTVGRANSNLGTA